MRELFRDSRSTIESSGHENRSIHEWPKPYQKERRSRRIKNMSIIGRGRVGFFSIGNMFCMFLALFPHVGVVTCFSFLPVRTVVWTRYTSPTASSHFIKIKPCYSSRSDDPKLSGDDGHELNSSSSNSDENGGNIVDDNDKVNIGDEDEIDDGKFQIATGISVSDSISKSSDQENISNGVHIQIQQQQQQIDMLIEMMKNQAAVKDQQPTTAADENVKTPPLPSIAARDLSSSLPPPLPGMFNEEGEDEISDYSDSPLTEPRLKASSEELSPKSSATSLTPLKAMLFIDGTWLYYSLYRRKEQEDPIVKKFGKGWQHRYRFDWSALPRIICEQIAGQENNMSWTSTGIPQTTNSDDVPLSNTQRPIEIVRAPVFTSYKKTTDPNSRRVKMFNEMADANYDIHMLESFGNGPEKCVDISLAVEMLHYATVPNAYDVAILLSGDKDFIPALVRTRQKGKKVGVVSMHTGCNRALYDSPHVKDYDVVWIDNALDELIVPLPPEEVGKVVQGIYDRGLLSAFTISKVLLAFVNQSPTGRVSSRDVGRYLKGLQIMDGTNLLDDLKVGRGGLRRFLQERMSLAFTVIDPTQGEIYNRDSQDRSYWISKTNEATNIIVQEAKATSFSNEEKQFLDDFESGKVGGDINENTYYHTNGGVGSPGLDVPKQINLDVLPPDLIEDYTTFTVARLKVRCRERGIPVTGTKSILLERVQEDVTSQISQLRAQVKKIVSVQGFDKDVPTSVRGTKRTPPKGDVGLQVTIHIEKLVKYYISQMGGEVSSRDLGRYLAANNACIPVSGNTKSTALQELKDNFGTLASFFDYKNDVFERSGSTDSSEFGFGIKLKASNPPSLTASKSPSSEKQGNLSGEIHLESLVKEYIAASGGHAMSRNLGRYLAANDSSQGNNQTALQQLKDEFGSLANFLNLKEAIFSLVKDNSHKASDVSVPPSTYNFGVTMKAPN